MKKKILIIGGTGFIGSHIVKNLPKKNFLVYSLSKKKLRNSKKINKVKYIYADITKISQLRKKINENFDHVINLSGYIDHSNKIANYNCHFLGTKNILKSLKLKNLKTFIQVGSSLEYGKTNSPQREKNNCKPVGSYGLSKYNASKFVMKLGRTKNLPYIILRPYQVFGPNQKINRLIPQTIFSCLKNKKFKCSIGTQLRDFIYIDDFYNLLKKIIQNSNIRKDIFNIGSGKPVSVKFIINKINFIIKKGKPKFGSIPMRKDEIKNLYPSIKKVKRKFLWSPKISLMSGLKKTIKFYEKNL